MAPRPISASITHGPSQRPIMQSLPRSSISHDRPASHTMTAMTELPTALLLIAHGSREPGANADLHWLADELRATGGYAAVVAAFLELAEPVIDAGGAASASGSPVAARTGPSVTPGCRLRASIPRGSVP